MSKRRRRDNRFQVEHLENRAVPSVNIVKAAIDKSDDIHIIGYIERTPLEGLSLSVSTTLDFPGRGPDIVTLNPPNTSIRPLPTFPKPKLPHGVKEHEITGVFNTIYSAPNGFKPKDVKKVVVNVQLVRSNGQRVESARKEQKDLVKLTGSSPYLA